jgi:SAM-dependent methyltransferase
MLATASVTAASSVNQNLPRTLTPAERMRQALQMVQQDGLAPVAIYRSGRHTGLVLPSLLDSPVEVSFFIDDHPERQGSHVLGWKIIAPEDADVRNVKAVILNSEFQEDRLWQQRDRFEQQGIRVVRLYGDQQNAFRGEDIAAIESAMNGSGQLSRNQLQQFWSTRGETAAAGNQPYDYAESPKAATRSLLLARWLSEAGITADESILELGCNAGRNLAALRCCGFRNLTGIEINPNALSAMQTAFPVTAREARLLNGTIEAVLPTFPDRSHAVIFTMAVLEHIHPDSEALVFDAMVRVAGRYILTIEDETHTTPRHFPRDYARVFEARRCRQVSSIRFKDLDEEHRRLFQLDTSFVARLFATPS